MGRFLRILGTVLGVIVVLGLLFLWFWDFSRYEPQIESAVSNALGREFRINGDFAVEVLPTPTVLVENATLANAGWGDEPSMVEVGRAYVEVGFWSLLFRPVEVRRLELSDIDVVLESNADGEANWQFDTPGAEEEPTGEDDSGVPVDILSADISNVRLAYRQGDADALQLLLKSLVASAGTSGGSLDVTASMGSVAEIGKRYHASNLPEGDLSLTGNVALQDGALILTDLLASLDGLEVSVDGAVGTNVLKLTVAAAGESLRAFDEDLPAIPFAISGDVSLSGTTVDVAPFDMTLGGSGMTGDLHFTGGDQPELSVNATAPMIDLRPFMPEEEGGGAANDGAIEKNGQYVFKDDPLPLDTLNSLSADVKVSIKELVMRNTQLNNIEFTGTLADGALQINNTFDGQYQGKYTNDIRFEATGDTARLELETVVKELKLGLFAGEGVPVDQISATNLDVGITATGSTPRALASSADGRAILTQGPGKTRNGIVNSLTGDIIAQLFTALNPFAKKEEFTAWDCTVFGIDFDSGVGTITGLLLQSERLMVVGGGKIDLTNEKLDIEFNTKPRAGVGVSADMFVTPFVKLSGTLADPRVGLNEKGMLLSGGAAVLTGGLSFLYTGLIDRATAEGSQCDKALEAVGTVAHENES